jgi:hypothetical protein
MTSVVTVFDADTVEACVQRVMQAVVDAADALPNVTPLPARQITTSAGATWDCEMTYVSFMTAQLGLPEAVGEQVSLTGVNTWPPGNLSVWTITCEVGVIRKLTALPAPAARPTAAPATDKFGFDLTKVSSDVAVIVNGAMTLAARNLQPVPHEGNAALSEGGFHGVQFRFTVEAFPGPS